jgi:hypothetical protein
MSAPKVLIAVLQNSEDFKRLCEPNLVAVANTVRAANIAQSSPQEVARFQLCKKVLEKNPISINNAVSTICNETDLLDLNASFDELNTAIQNAFTTKFDQIAGI